jgi:hypothetical protein
METDMDTFEEKYRWNAFLNNFLAAVGVLSPHQNSTKIINALKHIYFSTIV